MTGKHDKTLEALRTAIEMEKDGKECYLQAILTNTTEPAKLLLQALADEEDEHRRKLEKIYKTVRAQKSWPPINFQDGAKEPLRELFTRTCTALGANIRPFASELDVIRIAIDKENKSFDFYASQARLSTYASERAFYEAISREENEHHLVLLDYYELLMDPESWFLRKEHQSLDG